MYKYQDTTTFQYNVGYSVQPNTVLNNSSLGLPSSALYDRINTGDDIRSQASGIFANHVTWFNGVNFFVSS